mmetsp:Transcript_19631/g.52086  ORF Transcript_19631/g.52086 Transcript_19631/m.52086 type:complete len:214 (+) Transcript_19631:210-851(+)
MTLVQAAAKSSTNRALASAHAYFSAIARSSGFDPKQRSTPLAFHTTLLESPSRATASYTPPAAAFHWYRMSSRFTKKLLSSLSPAFSHSAPRLVDFPALTPITRNPATNSAMSLAVRPRRCARSTSSEGVPLKFLNASLSGSRTWNDSTSVCSCEASPRPVATATFTPFTPAFLAASSTAAEPAKTIKSARLTSEKSARTVSKTPRTFANCAG